MLYLYQIQIAIKVVMLKFAALLRCNCCVFQVCLFSSYQCTCTNLSVNYLQGRNFYFVLSMNAKSYLSLTFKLFCSITPIVKIFCMPFQIINLTDYTNMICNEDHSKLILLGLLRQCCDTFPKRVRKTSFKRSMLKQVYCCFILLMNN